MSDILKVVRPYLATPWVRHGDQPLAGWDCFGLLKFGRREWFGRPTPHLAEAWTPEVAADPARVEARIREGLAAWREVEPRPGAAILFEVLGRVCHVGLLLTDRHFIHADEAAGTTVEDVRGRWGRRVRGFHDC